MEKILSEAEAQSVIESLSEVEIEEIKRDKVRFGEFFVGLENNRYYRVNPINVIYVDGKFKSITPFSASAGI
ncbi:MULTISPECIES: hypothetical protein [Desertivirga]|uniref:hypothetical protein n=1 Tax=Desertivirga TaxID=3153690 RepID=UPI001A96FEBB|nr:MULTISPECIES: hypothetical protein [unclassified Pedobacter]